MIKDLENIIETVDVRGILVVCKKSQWEKHITLLHPEVVGKEKIVENTIKTPEAIYQSEEDQKRDVYFDKIDNNNKYMKVIVEMSSPNYGEIVTAFPRKGITGNIDMKVMKYDKSKL